MIGWSAVGHPVSISDRPVRIDGGADAGVDVIDAFVTLPVGVFIDAHLRQRSTYGRMMWSWGEFPMSEIAPPAAESSPGRDRSPVPRVVRWGLVGLALSAVGVVAMPSPPTGPSPVDTTEAGEEDLPSGPVEMAALSGSGLPGPDADGEAALPSSAESGIRPDDVRLGALYRLVDETCGVMPERIATGADALTIDLPLAAADDPCLDEVALKFDREHPGAPELLFDVLAATKERGLPVLHISAMHAGPLPYLHLKSGKTLFIGAIVDGWELSSIDENVAVFTYGDRTFTLSASMDEGHS